jgi:dihydroorotase
MEEIEIIKPDDWHIHFRDGEFLNKVVPETSKHFARGIIMPNLVPPILNQKNAIDYKNRIKNAIPKNHDFDPLMTLYLTDNTSEKELKNSFLQNSVFAAKLYPAGATTNSDSGVTNIDKIMNLLELMSEIGMPLLIHGESTHEEVDIFDREKVFIDNTLDYIFRNLPNLKITLEHITTKEATQYVLEGNENLVASVTPHHLALNRNAIFLGGIRPHYYCLPILKREKHRQALLKVVTANNNKKFFLGTDTAPHLITDKESSCGCAGIFNAPYCLPIITQIFDNLNALKNLEKFVSLNGANHYKISKNKSKIMLKKKNRALTFKNSLSVKNSEIIIFQPDFPVYWDVETKL